MQATVVCLLAVLCAAQVIDAGPLDTLKAQLDRAKSNVESNINDLERFKRNLEFTSSSQVSRKKSDSMMNINDIVNPAVNDIRGQVDQAKAEGKNAEQCYTNAQQTLRSLSQKGFSDLNSCENSANNAFRAQLAPLDQSVSIGNGLLQELNGVFLGCYSGNIMQMQTCIAIKLGTVNMTVRNWENGLSSLKMSASRASNQAVLDVTSCGFNVVSVVRSGTTDVRLAANSCVKSA